MVGPVIIGWFHYNFQVGTDDLFNHIGYIHYRIIFITGVKGFFVDYWITTHKELKALARQYDLSPFVGLYYERLALLRAFYILAAGKDISGRVTLHMLGALHRGLGDKITQEQKDILGLPSSTPRETVVAIQAIRSEMARIGRELSKQYVFDYPYELEDVVQKTWNEHKEAIVKR